MNELIRSSCVAAAVAVAVWGVPAVGQTRAAVVVASKEYEDAERQATQLLAEAEKRYRDALVVKARRDVIAQEAARIRADAARRYLAAVGVPAPLATEPLVDAPPAVPPAGKAKAPDAKPADPPVDAGKASDTKSADQEKTTTAAAGDADRKISATRAFAGLDLDVGLSLTVDLGSRDRVVSAEKVNGLVRVTEVRNSSPRVMLGTHYFFLPDHYFLGLKPKQWGVGPFLAVQPGTDEIIQAIGLGVMFGFRRSLESRESFNLGIGLVIDPSVKVLGDGIYPDRPLPDGEDEVRFKTTSQKGLLLYSSFSF